MVRQPMFDYWIKLTIKILSSRLGIFLVLKPGYYHITAAAHGYLVDSHYTGIALYHNARLLTFKWVQHC